MRLSTIALAMRLFDHRVERCVCSTIALSDADEGSRAALAHGSAGLSAVRRVATLDSERVYLIRGGGFPQASLRDAW